MSRRHAAGLALGVSLATLAVARLDSQAQAPPLSLEVLEARAVDRHPAIREAAARVDVARGRARQAGAWENPAVGGTVSELRPRESPSGLFGGFVEQTVTLGGKRGADRAAAAADVVVREAELEGVRQYVRLAVRVAYYELAAAAERLAVTERIAAVSDEWVAITRQLVNVGVADRPDVLEAEAESARQRATLASARAHQVGAWRRLAAATADLTLAVPPLIGLTDQTIPVLDRQLSLNRIFEISPEVRAAEAEVARERLSVEVERRRVFPDLTFRAEAGWNRERQPSELPSRPLGWQYGVDAGLTLPLFNRNRGGLMTARSSVTASEARAARVRLDIETRFASSFEEYETARVLAEAYKAEVLPRLEEAHRLHLARYREMAAPYTQVLMAQRTLISTTEDYLDALTRTWRAAARVQGLLLGMER